MDPKGNTYDNLSLPSRRRFTDSENFFVPLSQQNDISHWKWQELLSFFNADNIPCRTYLASTRAEFETILADKAFRSADCCQLLEVKMGRLDGPRILVEQAKLSAELNSG